MSNKLSSSCQSRCSDDLKAGSATLHVHYLPKNIHAPHDEMFVSFDVRRRNEQSSLRDALKMINLSLLPQCWANDPNCDFSPSVLGSQKPSYDAATEASFRVAAATASGRSEYLDDRDTENGFAFTKYSDYDTYEAAQFKARKVFGREVQQTHGWQDYIDDQPSFHDHYRRLLGIKGTGDDIRFINPDERSKVRADGTLIVVETSRATEDPGEKLASERPLLSLLSQAARYLPF